MLLCLECSLRIHRNYPSTTHSRTTCSTESANLTPWYADIVNFMVAGYVPPGENKKKLIYESWFHIWDDPYLFRVCSDGLLRRCVPAEEGIKNYWKMSLITIWRTLWGIPHTLKDLAKWILLANNVQRHKRFHPKVQCMSETWQHQFKRCHATHQ